jgi:hypothetical protein
MFHKFGNCLEFERLTPEVSSKTSARQEKLAAPDDRGGLVFLRTSFSSMHQPRQHRVDDEREQH